MEAVTAYDDQPLLKFLAKRREAPLTAVPMYPQNEVATERRVLANLGEGSYRFRESVALQYCAQR